MQRKWQNYTQHTFHTHTRIMRVRARKGGHREHSKFAPTSDILTQFYINIVMCNNKNKQKLNKVAWFVPLCDYTQPIAKYTLQNLKKRTIYNKKFAYKKTKQ